MAAERPRKRLKATASLPPTIRTPLFAPFRALGLVTNSVPFALQTRTNKGAADAPRVHLLSCLGSSWALWEAAKMGLLFVGPDEHTPISALALDGDAVWAAVGSSCVKYLRGKEVARLHNPFESHLGPMILFGTQLVVLAADGQHLLVWNTDSQELAASVQFDTDFTATTVLHPATYLNKVLVGSAQGALQLWNIRTRTCIHRFDASMLRDAGKTASPITSLVQSPAIDVVGIGFASGEISVYDIRADERLMRMFMDGGAVRALSFRSDGQSVLVSASSTGHVALWDLNGGGRIMHIVRGAHDGAVASAEWIPGQPVLVTSGEDNSIKQWVFDSPTSPPRLLKFRSGHHAPPHIIRYYGEDGKQLLTASRDRSLRCTSVVRDARSFELSQGHLAKKAISLSTSLAYLKFPPVVSISYSSIRSKDWDDVLTAHTDERVSRTWTVRDKKLGKHTLELMPTGKSKRPVGSAKVVCVTACGNFGLAGSSTGVINMWNMQSGMHRKSFDVGPIPPECAGRIGDSKNSCMVTGIATDSLNTMVVASTQEGLICCFDFHSTKLEHTSTLPSTVASILLHRDSGLLAICCDDQILRVMDIETRRIVREFGGFQGRILDVTFSPDSRWLLATSLDSVIRTFDLPSGRLVDAFRTSSAATSISFSPTNDFLATAHGDSVGIFLWANRAQYTDVSLKGIPADAPVEEVAMPSMQGDDDARAAEELEALSSLEVEDPTDVFVTPSQLESELVTLTLLPRSRWQTLLNLEVIQQRNRPKEAPKRPEKAPFFLPTLPGVETRFAIDEAPAKETQSKTTQRLNNAADAQSTFMTKLTEGDGAGNYETFFSYMKMLSPSAIDLEIRSLTTLDALRSFIVALHRRVRSHRDFEAVQTFMNVFLQVHGDVLIANAELRSELEGLLVAQKNESNRVLELLSSSLGTGYHFMVNSAA